MLPETPSTPSDEVLRHLTESILTLKQTIRNVREDFANGITPSMIMPSDAAPDLQPGMVMLTLEPSAAAIDENLSPIEDRLRKCETILKQHGHWRNPNDLPKSPEYSIIDVSDLSSATGIIEDIIKHTYAVKKPSPQDFFGFHDWIWDPIWKEFYALIPGQPTHLYLSRWTLNVQHQTWEHKSMAHLDLTPDAAAQMLGSWEDWAWDPVWREWYLDVSNENDQDEVCHVYTSPWQSQHDGNWVYTGRLESIA